MPGSTAVDVVKRATNWSIVWGVLLVIFGVLAVGSPFLAAIAASVFIAWLILLAGVVHLIFALHEHRAGSVIWQVLVGAAYLFFGGYLIAHPVLAVASLTLVLAALFLIEGILEIILFLRMHSAEASAWVLIDGIVTLVLGLLIYLQWPSSSLWAVGLLVGASMIISGVSRTMLSLALRRAAPKEAY
jgi:uncharacterized membrane protein HdeD (DUF308 family)